MPFLETINLYQKQGERYILKDINLKMERGDTFALIGPTGAGKSTLLRLVDLLNTPTSGKLFFDGIDTSQSPKTRLQIRRRMAFILQKPVVFNMNVFDNVAYGLKWRGMDKTNICRKVDDILAMTNLNLYRTRDARTLSGGEIQRVAIARAIVTEPELLLLDEPTANLDPLSAIKIEGLIEDVIRRYHTTTIMATHDMSQGQRLANQIAVLMNGEIQQTGLSKDVFTRPDSLDIAEFIGCENILPGIITSNETGVVTVQIDNGTVIEAISDYAVGEEVVACIRPENISLSSTKISSSARNSFKGVVSNMINRGALIQVELDCGFLLSLLITKRSADEMGLDKGKKVYATFKATGVHIIQK